MARYSIGQSEGENLDHKADRSMRLTDWLREFTDRQFLVEQAREAAKIEKRKANPDGH